MLAQEATAHKTKKAACVTAGGLRSSLKEIGADGGTRTRDLCFTKALLYQLSYIGLLWAQESKGLIGRRPA